mgnify:CR=1 FL=1
MTTPFLSVRDVHAYYGESYIVQGVSFDLEETQILALLGRNGAGKTSILRTLARTETPALRSGEISMGGVELHKMQSHQAAQHGLQLVPEDRRIIQGLTVEENLLTGAYTRKDGGAAMRADLEMVYNYFPCLRERRRSLAGYISGGEQQMCAIGRAMMASPTTVLLDEPSMGLAPQLVEESVGIVRSLNQEQGVSVLLAEQNTNMALKYADYGYILENGRVVMDGNAKELAENALDAGARRIDITAEGGGLVRLLIEDDGKGMSPQELELCIERHATSKLPVGDNGQDDLLNISTMGFRGEALPSIGSIARLSITTPAKAAGGSGGILFQGA